MARRATRRNHPVPVGDQVGEDAADAALVAGDDPAVALPRETDGHIMGLGDRMQVFGDLLDAAAERKPLALHAQLAGAGPRQLEQILDHVGQPLAFAVDDAQLRHLGRVLLAALQRVDVAFDDRERRAQLV
jgi:hypothetical protein